MHRMTPRLLDLSVPEFTRLAEQVVRDAATYLGGMNGRSIKPSSTGAETWELFSGPAPEEGMGAAALDVLPLVAEHARAGNGRFFGYVMGSGEPVAALGDLFASVLNQNGTAWRSGPATAVIERTVVSWVASAMAMLGLGRDNLRLIPVEDDFTMSANALREAIAVDVAAGLDPIAVVANGGTIVTGAVDPLAEVVAIARDYDMWVHVDGAYGVPAAMVSPEQFRGLAEVDSVSLDAHKWMYQPLDCSILLYADRAAARRTFSFTDDYAASLTTDPVEGDVFFEETIELSRRIRALKLWLSLRYHGLAAYRGAIAGNIRQAQLLASLVDSSPSLERMADVPLSAVNFRWTGDGAGPDVGDLDKRNAAILEEVNRRGRVYLSNATIRGSFVLRACITNHRTTDDDVAEVVAEVLAAAADLDKN
jgi:aromatic-L-amino-acid decarboxylase